MELKLNTRILMIVFGLGLLTTLVGTVMSVKALIGQKSDVPAFSETASIPPPATSP